MPHTLLGDSKMHGTQSLTSPTHNEEKKQTRIQLIYRKAEVPRRWGLIFSGKYENKDFTEKMILELTLNYEWDFSRFFFEEEWPGKEKSL